MQYLQRCARQSHELGAAKTVLAIDDADKIILGFYSLAPGALAYPETPEIIRKGLQKSCPGFRLARIATNLREQGQGLGGQFLAAVARRCLRVAAEVGGVILIIDAKGGRAAGLVCRLRRGAFKGQAAHANDVACDFRRRSEVQGPSLTQKGERAAAIRGSEFGCSPSYRVSSRIKL